MPNQPHSPSGHDKITLEQVRHVAKLSRLALDESRLQHLTVELESILEYVAQIGRADSPGAGPVAHVSPGSTAVRDEVAAPPLPLDKVLQNAPETDGPFF